jgi:transcriptional regulator with XRE-family HTH domain
LPRRSVSTRGPHPVDVAVGARLRIARREKGLSQSNLASALGLTFQQVQKYENGLNRVSASRLVDIARILEVSASGLLGDYDQAISPAIDWADCTAEVMTLVTAYRRIRSEKLRRAAWTLIAILGEDSAPIPTAAGP